MSTITPTSQQIQQDLNNWFASSGYEDIKFFVSPNVESSVDECASDALASIRRLEEGKLEKISTLNT